MRGPNQGRNHVHPGPAALGGSGGPEARPDEQPSAAGGARTREARDPVEIPFSRPPFPPGASLLGGVGLGSYPLVRAELRPVVKATLSARQELSVEERPMLAPGRHAASN
jgi:hypothetical protein